MDSYPAPTESASVRGLLQFHKVHGFAAALLCLTMLRASGGDAPVKTAYLAATEFRNQGGANAPALDPHRPYRIGSELQLEGVVPRGGRLDSPARSWRYERIEGDGLWLGVDFHDFPAMHSAFPAGDYTWRVETGTPPAATGTLTLAPFSFPQAPYIAPGGNMAWIGLRLVITDPSAPAVIGWQRPGPDVYEVFVTVNGMAMTLDAAATSHELSREAIAGLPLETPVNCLVQFNSPTGHAATVVWLWVPRTEEKAYLTVMKTRVYRQESNGPPQPWTPSGAALSDSDFGPCQFTISAASSGNVTGPGGKLFPLTFTYPGSALYNSGPYDTQAALDADHPDGTYTWGDQKATLSKPRFPNNGVPVKLLSVNDRPPRWRDGKLLLDPKRDNTLVWSAWRPIQGLPFASRGLITLSFGYLSSASWQITKEVEAGFHSARRRPFNRHRLAANTLQTDRDYRLSIRYSLASQLDRRGWTAAGGATITYVDVLPEP